MKKLILFWFFGVTPNLLYAHSFSDQLICKDLQLYKNNKQPNVVFDSEFQVIFERGFGYKNKHEYKHNYVYKSKNYLRDRIQIEGLPVLWIYTGYEVTKGLDDNKIDRIYTRTVFEGDLENVKKTLEKKLNYKFYKHVYPNNRYGRYMYYVAQRDSDGATVVATIQDGAATKQIHVSCNSYNKNISYLLENSVMFRKAPHQ